MLRRMLLILVALAVVLTTGFLWWNQSQVTPPHPDARAAALCRSLHEALPHTLQGNKRNDPRPSSPYTAAWSSHPRTVLKCGVPVPQLLIKHPESDAVNVNGVDWLIEPLKGGSYRFTTVQRNANVEVTVPNGAFPSPTDALPPISDAVRRTVPSRFPE
jgi:hypothetical protein